MTPPFEIYKENPDNAKKAVIIMPVISINRLFKVMPKENPAIVCACLPKMNNAHIMRTMSNIKYLSFVLLHEMYNKVQK